MVGSKNGHPFLTTGGGLEVLLGWLRGDVPPVCVLSEVHDHLEVIGTGFSDLSMFVFILH